MPGQRFSVIFVFLLSLLAVGFVSVQPIKNEQCEYDMDLVKNTMKVVCKGDSARVNIIAHNAVVSQPSSRFESTGEMPPGSNQDWMPYGDMNTLNSIPLSNTVKNSTKHIELLKQRLSMHSSAMFNITTLLTEGDEGLTSDLKKLRRLAPNKEALKEGMLAAIRNQYNFMRTAILTQNAELSKLISSLNSLLDITAKAMRGAAKSDDDIVEQIGYVNKTMITMRRMMSKELKKQRHRPTNNQGNCPLEIAAIGNGHAMDVRVKKGTIMRDGGAISDKLWIMEGGRSSDQLIEYDSEIDQEYQLFSKAHTLPFRCEGTGHVMYMAHLICQKADSNTIVKYDMDEMLIVAEVSLGTAGVQGTYPYQFGGYSDIDLAVDELGLWVVYAMPDSAGKMMISKLNADNLMIEKTWMTRYPKAMVGNTFMICGVLYGTNSYKDSPTFIKYRYDTETGRDKILKDGKLQFANGVRQKSPNTVMLDYNPGDRRLYAWNNGKGELYPVFFREIP
ncbi:hypothetical protein SNE40_001854 [Patella caerulea]|uniref:Olfactomedin-like domain-containing protein n=1 Tax=Patella caerulea TaxID=87958 RepID=A0AAN8KBY7_PATCE